MKSLFAICMLLSLSQFARSQGTEDSVKNVVNKLFDGMKQSNRAMLLNCFADSAVLQTIGRNREGKLIVRNESIQDFAASIASTAPGSLDERISFNMIKIDGDLASVWTPYSFYYNNKFSHCGVNSFQLVRTADGWKIQYIIDTRRKDQCL